MDIKEYNEEVSILKENISACNANKKTLKLENEIIQQQLFMRPQNDELIRFKVKTNDRYNLNEEMIKTLNCALRILREDKYSSDLYNSYIDIYAELVKRFVSLSESEEFVYLANKYLPSAEIINEIL